MQPLPKGDRVAIITNAGGPGIMAADAVGAVRPEGRHARPAAPRRRCASKLPAAASVGNPMDVLGDADPDRYVMAVEAAQDDPDVDAIIVILTPQAMTQPAETARAIAACNRREQAGAGRLHGRRRRHARPGGAGGRRPARLPLARARRGRAAGHVRLRRLAAPPAAHRDPLPGQPPPRGAHHPAPHAEPASMQIGEVKAKDILRAYDFIVPDGQLAATADEAVEIAERIGYPVVMKIVSPDIIHKSDIGGVKLNLDQRRSRCATRST